MSLFEANIIRVGGKGIVRKHGVLNPDIFLKGPFGEKGGFGLISGTPLGWSFADRNSGSTDVLK
jgi:hypothetical protein